MGSIDIWISNCDMNKKNDNIYLPLFFSLTKLLYELGSFFPDRPDQWYWSITAESHLHGFCFSEQTVLSKMATLSLSWQDSLTGIYPENLLGRIQLQLWKDCDLIKKKCIKQPWRKDSTSYSVKKLKCSLPCCFLSSSLLSRDMGDCERKIIYQG